MSDSTTYQFWTDEPHSIGDEGFIVETSHTLQGWTRYALRDRPASTNMSRVPRLWGWCGTTNDVSTHAHGVGKVVSVARNGRCRIEPITDAEDIRRILEELGYPELEGGEP
ncbi:MAG: hypothetical protein IT186_25595 [Acidobacteria bacterium]|nr:hypothetical protein [Acidobacteriota bacterium]